MGIIKLRFIMKSKKKNRKKIEQELLKKLDSLDYVFQKNSVMDLIELAGNTKKFLSK